jgi:ribosomal protein L32
VLRDGIDIPELYHGILATPFGSIQSYIQTVGRILRSHPSTPEVLLQDHGGNWWRHGSPNADRDWAGVWGLTDYQIVTRQIEKMQQKEEAEPICCPECGTVRRSGMECHKCGYRAAKKSRKVIQRNGELKEVTGDIFRERKVKCKPDTQKMWERCYYRMKKAGQTFKQAEALFFREHNYWPPRSLPLMPANPLDWERKVKDVPFDKLIPKGELQ